MSPLSNRTVSFVSVAALLALVGCQSPGEDGTFETLASSSTLRTPSLDVPVHETEVHELADPIYRPLPSSAVRSGAEPHAMSASEGVASLGASVPVSRVVRADSPALAALGASPASPPVLTAIQPGSPAVRALAAAVASPAAAPFVVECASDADCMIDACDVTSCVSETSLLERDFICVAEETVHAAPQEGCLCQAGRCGWGTQPIGREGI